MNPHEPPSDLEATLRRLVTPEPAVVERVLAGALGASRYDARRRTRWTWAGAALATVALSVGLWQWPQLASLPGEPVTLTITGDRARVVVEHRDGRRWIVTPRSDRVTRGSYVIVVER